MPIKNQCPACAAPDMRAFYEVTAVPVESSIVLHNAEEALSIATGDIVLGLCTRCGLIANLAYPSRSQLPSTAYEDQQGFSPTFNAFAERIADALADRYGLDGKTVVEIGCGKGDFLALLCERSDCAAVGIDPLFDGTRLPPALAGRVRAVPERYARAHARFGADLVVCRHTLEHIPDTAEMLSVVRETLDGSRGTAVVIEVPDVVRVLEEGAFWDVYYEHCTYFSPGSLARALRITGHEVTDLHREYDDQYLIAHARAGSGRGSATLAIEETPAEVERLAERFAALAAESMERWRERAGARPVLWGSGSKAVAFVSSLGIADRVAGIVDINPHRHGRYVPGIAHPVMAPEGLRRDPPETVIAMNPIYRDEIERALRDLGLDSEVVAAM